MDAREKRMQALIQLLQRVFIRLVLGLRLAFGLAQLGVEARKGGEGGKLRRAVTPRHGGVGLRAVVRQMQKLAVVVLHAR